MAVLPDAVEIWDYVPEWPSAPAVLSDRWIVVADNKADEFLIFDTQRGSGSRAGQRSARGYLTRSPIGLRVAD